MTRVQTSMFTLPTLIPDDSSTKVQGKSDLEDMKKCLSEGYHITLMNDFVYQGIAWTHYVLEREVDALDEFNKTVAESWNRRIRP